MMILMSLAAILGVSWCHDTLRFGQWGVNKCFDNPKIFGTNHNKFFQFLS